MKNAQDIKNQLTDLEFQSLTYIINSYDSRDIVCYTERLTPSEKGVFGSLVKKGMIYDSYAGLHDDYQGGNWFPSEEVIVAFGLPEYQP